MRFNLRNLRVKDVIIGAVAFLVACILPGISNILVGENGLVYKLRSMVQNFTKK